MKRVVSPAPIVNFCQSIIALWVVVVTVNAAPFCWKAALPATTVGSAGSAKLAAEKHSDMAKASGRRAKCKTRDDFIGWVR